MKNSTLLFLIAILLLSCSKHDRINPYDPNSSTWLPWTGAVSDTTVDINDPFTMYVQNHSPEAVSSYHWIINARETTTTVDSLLFSFADTGLYPLVFYTINKNDIPSQPDTSLITITASYPIITPISDTVINDVSFQVTPTAIDTNSTGSIVSYYWYPQTVPSQKKIESPFVIKPTDLTHGTIVWAAVDDDGLESVDSFSLRFNRAPIITAIRLSNFWYDYNHETGTGSVKVEIISTDPDSTLDVLSNSISNLPAPHSTNVISSSEIHIQNISPTATVPFRITAADTVGGASVLDTSVTTGVAPAQKKIFCANSPFIMGDNSEWKDNIEQPLHSVTVTHDLWVDSIEVTQGLFDSIGSSITGYTAPAWESKFGLGATYPAYSVSWEEALLFCNARSKQDGFDTVYTYDAVTGNWGDDLTISNVRMQLQNSGYRLPTEAEWELLCRAGTSTTFHWGDSETEEQANLYSWNSSNSNKTSHPTAQKQPNLYGLYDLCGNLSEWCWDYFDENYYDVSPESDPTGPTTGSEHVVRGGGRHSIIEFSLRSGARESSSKASRRIGFRTVRTASE